MDKYLLALICQLSANESTNYKCREVVKMTVREWQIYQTIKEKEKYYKLQAEDLLTKPGFWALTTGIASVSGQKLYLTGHNIVGIDSVNLKIGKESEISLTWSF